MRLKAPVPKLYASNFLTGLVFWYGIEKLFMRGIGLSPTQIGLALAVMSVVTLAADIPAGMLADRWSRKGVIVLSALCLAVASLVCGTSHGLWQYSIGYAFYGLYLVCASGTYQALMYDVLHEQGRAQQYSKLMGRAYACFLCGAGVGNILGGYLAESTTLRTAFVVSIVPCLVNCLLSGTIREPSFHKKEQKEKLLSQLRESVRALWSLALLRILLVMWCTLAIIDPFNQEFSQLYMLHFTAQPVALGLLWAGGAFAWAAGSALAHRFQRRLTAAMLFAFLPLVALGAVREWWGLGLYFVELAGCAIATNLIETNLQHQTPSAVRTSTLSCLSFLNRLIGLPVGIGLGLLASRFGIFQMVQMVAGVAAVGLAFWLVKRPRLPTLLPAKIESAAEFDKP